MKLYKFSKTVVILLLIVFSVVTVYAGRVKVKGYYRKDGTYVAPHYRTSPNSTPTDNYSYPGNYNPNTGKVSTGNPNTYLKRYNNKTNKSSSWDLRSRDTVYKDSSKNKPYTPFCSSSRLSDSNNRVEYKVVDGVTHLKIVGKKPARKSSIKNKQPGNPWDDLAGELWEDMTEDHKTVWLFGFMMGVGVGCKHLEWTSTNFDKLLPEDPVGIYEAIIASHRERTESLVLRGGPIQKGLNKFYEDYRNQNIKIVDAVYVVKMEIEGKRPELIEAQKIYLRMGPGSSAEFPKSTLSISMLKDILSELPGEPYKNVKRWRYSLFTTGVLADPRVEEPQKVDDYNYTRLFAHGTYYK